MPLSKIARKRSHQSFFEMPQAIFIHAGAGFHSIQNEKIHLSVCSKYAFPSSRYEVEITDRDQSCE